ncbi:MAG: Hsp20/alpha crystallin family protein [Myxococcota bacterium]
MISIRNRDRFNDLFWGPWGDLERFQREIDQLFFSKDALNYRRAPAAHSNVFTDEERALVQLSVPGVSRNAVTIEVEGQTLNVSAKPAATEDSEFLRREFATEGFNRSFELPFSIDAERVSAKLEDGVLEIELPRAEADKPRKISIQ